MKTLTQRLKIRVLETSLPKRSRVRPAVQPQHHPGKKG